jgi:hypothetical protein
MVKKAKEHFHNLLPPNKVLTKYIIPTLGG